MNEPYYERAIDLLAADVGDELVALDADAGHCYGFNSVAASVWRQLDQPRTFDELKTALIDEYDVSEERCVADLSELLEDFVARKLLRRTSGLAAR
jgi:hypothetical protein